MTLTPVGTGDWFGQRQNDPLLSCNGKSPTAEYRMPKTLNIGAGDRNPGLERSDLLRTTPELGVQMAIGHFIENGHRLGSLETGYGDPLIH